jgi:hypothetical protein
MGQLNTHEHSEKHEKRKGYKMNLHVPALCRLAKPQSCPHIEKESDDRHYGIDDAAGNGQVEDQSAEFGG